MQQVAPASNKPICHKVQQVALVCVTGTGSPGHSSGCAQSAMVGSGSMGGHVQPNPTEPAQSAQPVDTTIQSDPSQKSDKS